MLSIAAATPVPPGRIQPLEGEAIRVRRRSRQAEDPGNGPRPVRRGELHTPPADRVFPAGERRCVMEQPAVRVNGSDETPVDTQAVREPSQESRIHSTAERMQPAELGMAEESRPDLEVRVRGQMADWTLFTEPDELIRQCLDLCADQA